MPGTVTIAFNLRNPHTLAPAVGRVRVNVPRPLADTVADVVYGPAKGTWATLVDGQASVMLLDPQDPDVVPLGWAPVVELDTDVVRAAYAVVVPPGESGRTVPLADLSAAVTGEAETAYALWNHTHEGGGGGGVPESRQIVAGAGLTGGGTLAVDRTLSLSAASVSLLGLAATALQPLVLDDIDAVNAAQDAVTATKAPRIRVADAYIVSGNVALPDAGGVWRKPGDAAGLPVDFTLSLPAQVGDWVELGVGAMKTDTSSALLDLGVLHTDGLSVVRYLSTGGSVPAVEGPPDWYPASEDYIRTATPKGFIVQAQHLSAGGMVRFVVANLTQGQGTLYASASFPFYWCAKNFGPVGA